MAAKKRVVDFEQSLRQLETLVNDMEQGEMTLEESLKAFETGIKLTRECQARLTEAEQKVQLLIEEQGELRAVSFTGDDTTGDNTETP
ncbi:MAG: exodeoxyribonuclease VII small subunit [Exilibacterium sp.]